jgi:mannose/cellobiose epimerase-like protein (N-acyl-D-glucosamine 2-epimerase family)
MLVVPNHWFEWKRLLISSLSHGMSGTPRQVMT